MNKKKTLIISEVTNEVQAFIFIADAISKHWSYTNLNKNKEHIAKALEEGIAGWEKVFKETTILSNKNKASTKQINSLIGLTFLIPLGKRFLEYIKEYGFESIPVSLIEKETI